MIDKHFWFILHPDISRPIGGVKQIHRLCEALYANNCNASIVQDDAGFHPGWFSSNVKTISLSEWLSLKTLDPCRHVVVLPETLIQVYHKYHPELPLIVFNQNSSYTFGLGQSQLLSPYKVINFYRSAAVSHILCVSEYDKSYLVDFLGINAAKVSCLINAIEPECKPSPVKKKKLVYMPRKNPRDSFIVSSLIQDSYIFKDDWEILALKNLQHGDVLSQFAESLIFLSFGHPEGFGLPVAEAMACGCAVFGYSGLGGRELFDVDASSVVLNQIDFGDHPAFLSSFCDFAHTLSASPDFIANQLASVSAFIRQKYSFNALVDSVSLFLANFMS